MDGDDGCEFQALPESVKREIDSAFVAVLQPEPAHPSPRKRRKLDEAPSLAGGFLVEDPEPAAGGFILDDEFALETNRSDGHDGTHIPLRLIPTALQLLDLQPDDEDVLAVFQNAASGWGGGGDAEQGVSRKDWRAVCSVLLAQKDGDATDTQGPESVASAGDFASDVPEPLEEEEEDPEGEEDVYVDDDQDDQDDELSADDSDEDFGPSKKRPKKLKGLQNGASDGSGYPARQHLSRRQQREAREAFSLFFPNVPDDELDKQRIMIKDIVRVAKLLNEKISADDIIEMLQEFSTSADKSVGLEDFQVLAFAAKLI